MGRFGIVHDPSPFPIRSRLALLVVVMSMALWLGVTTASWAGVVEVAAGVEYNGDNIPFVLDEYGSVWSFLDPDELKDPFRIEGLHDIVKITSYGALRRDGRVFTWRLGPQDEEYLRTRGYRKGTVTSPKMVKGIFNAVSIDGTGRRFLALLANGTLMEWSDTPPPPSRKSYGPRPVPGITDVVAMTANGGGLVVTRDGNVRGWGVNSVGELGQTRRLEIIPSSESISVYEGGDATSVMRVSGYSIVLTRDGHLKYWGSCIADSVSNRRTRLESDVAGYVGDIDNVASIHGLEIHRYFLVIRRDGSVWSALPPDPANPPCSGSTSKPKAPNYHLEGLPVPIITGQLTTWGALLVGADHSLWYHSMGPRGAIPLIIKKIELLH